MDVEGGAPQEEDALGDKPQDWFGDDDGFNLAFSTGSGDPETLSVCNNQDSNETNTLRQVICQSQFGFLQDVYNSGVALDRPRMMEMLSRYREVLLSARECIAARAQSKAQSQPSIRKKIQKKAKNFRKKATFGGPLATPTDFGAQAFLPSPLMVNPATEMYYTDDSLSDASEDNFVAPGRDYGSTGEFAEKTNDELYGLAHLEYEAHDRNPYFNLALGDSMNDLGEFE